jgi:hypothetical protein
MNATVESFATGPMWTGFIAFVLAMPWFHMPIQWSLTIVGSIIAVSVVASLALSKPKLKILAAGEEA